MKKLFIVLAAVGLALSVDAASLTVHHKKAGDFANELMAANDGSNVYTEVTDLIIISDYNAESGEYVYFTNTDAKAMRVALKAYVKSVDLSQVKFKDGLTTYAEGDEWSGILNQMTVLTTVVFPEELDAIKIGACRDCLQLENVTLPKRCRIIDRYAFSGCPKLKLSGELPEGLEEIRDLAFGPKNDKVTSTGETEAKGVTFSYLPETVTVIGSDAFNGTKVRFDKLPDGLTKLGTRAFRKAEVTFKSLPASLTNTSNLGDAVFVNCMKMTEFTIDGILLTGGLKKTQILFFSDASGYFQNGQPARTMYCRSMTVPECYGIGNKTNAFSGSSPFGDEKVCNAITLYVPFDAVDRYKASGNYPYCSMNIQPLKATVTLSHDADQVTISHEHHGALAAGENEIYEGEHEWTFKPAWNKYVTRVYYDDAVSRAEGDVVYEAAEAPTYEAKKDYSIKVKVPVGAGARTLVVETETIDPTQTSLDFVPTAEKTVRYYNLNGVEVAHPTSGVYIERQCGVSRKVVL